MSRDGSRGLLAYQEWDGSNNKKPRALRYGAGAWESPLGVSLDAINANDRSGVPVAAVNGNGTLGGVAWRQVSGGQETARANRLTIRTPPSAPTNVTAEAVANDVALVSWTASQFDGNWPFPDYAAIAEPNDGVGCSTISTSCLVTGLVPGRTYRFFVYAENIEGATKSGLSAPITMPGGETPAPPGTGVSPPPPGDVTAQASAPGAVATITVKQRKKAEARKRTVVVRWSTASNASEYRVRITRPGAKRWRAWTTQTTTKKRYRVVVGKRYRVAVLPLAGDVAGTAAVKKFRAKR
jgi:hypothetical protein